MNFLTSAPLEKKFSLGTRLAKCRNVGACKIAVETADLMNIHVDEDVVMSQLTQFCCRVCCLLASAVFMCTCMSSRPPRV